MKRLLMTVLVVLTSASLDKLPSATSEIPFALSHLFSDGMIAQRDVIVPVWGSAPARAEVMITFGDVTQVVVSDKNGRWRGEIGSHPAGGPHELTVSSGGQSVSVVDILFGDVWIASGQSNMEWTVANSNNAEDEIRSADDPLIRHLKVPRSWSRNPESTLAAGEWHAADPEHVANFTAVGYFFAKEIRKTADVPIGIINTSWGGSRIEPWIERESVGLGDSDIDAILAEEDRRVENLKTVFSEHSGGSETEDPGLVDGVGVWADPDLDLSDWKDIAVPATWESVGYAGLDGVAWYRMSIELNEQRIGSDEAILHLGKIDDDDMTWVNGELVGSTSGWTLTRSYPVPHGILRPGSNTITVRVQDGGGGGGIYGEPDQIRLETGVTTIQLAGQWKFRIGQYVVSWGASVNQLPTLLYNKMIYPVQSFPVTGFLWYQGESNAGSEEDARNYDPLFKSLISSW